MVTIKVAPDSELFQRAKAARDTGAPLFLDDGDEVIRLRVEPGEDEAELEDENLSKASDSDLIRESIRKVAGTLTDEEAEAWKATIYRSRETGTRPLEIL